MKRLIIAQIAAIAAAASAANWDTFPAASYPLSGNETLPINQGNATKHVTVNELRPGNTTVTPGTYGGPDATLSLSVGPDGRITGAANATITLGGLGAGSAASSNATDFAPAAIAGNPSAVGEFSPSNWKTALAYTIADVPGLQGALDAKASLVGDNEFAGNVGIYQDTTAPSDTTNYALSISTSGSAVANFTAYANPYGNTDVSITESSTGYRWALAVYDDTPGLAGAGKFAFNCAGIGDAFEIHRDLNAFFWGSLVVGGNAESIPAAMVCAYSPYMAAAAFGYDESTYTLVSVDANGQTRFESTGVNPRYIFDSGPLNHSLSSKTSTSAGVPGDIAWDANYIYICTSPNVWKRVALTSF